ncbi:MAG: AsmA family protein, partial [Chitinophagaceae bacterium]|nr:AsmA family protein [Rubrivivax sp.]
EGRMGGQPLLATLRTGELLQAFDPVLDPGAEARGESPAGALPTHLRVRVGAARLAFDGSVNDLLGRFGLRGRYQASGPSLAAMGSALGLTLPTTREFAIQGRLTREGTRWFTAVQSATIGRSRLAGEFMFDTPPGTVPLLAGRLRGSVLWLEDLGPAVGVPGDDAAPASSKPGRVLPDRNFDLPSLRAMNANVLVALDRLESGSPRLQAVQPLGARIVLKDGVLNIQDIDAKLAQGRIRGQLQLDGRAALARWSTQLTGAGLQIERWILQPRVDREGKALPPYATGRLGARIDLAGQGRSTAELLGSANGRAVLHWTRGTLSHLVVEGAGIDIAEALGVLVRGDGALPVTCGAADLRIVKGVIRPEVMLVDTRDSTIWLDGSVSLASEQMQMVARVAPKDFSPLTLRTPLHIDGTLSDPSLSLEKGPLLRRLVPAALLAVLNPLAALLPLIDMGEDDEARQALSSCQSVVARRGG